MWQLARRVVVLTIDGHMEEVYASCFSPNGLSLLSASYDKTLALWDASSGKLTQCFQGHSGPVSCCSFRVYGTEMLSGSYDRTLILWNVKSGTILRRLEGHLDQVYCCCFASNELFGLSGSADATVKMWHLDNGCVTRTFNMHEQSVLSCSFSHNDMSILSSSKDGSVMMLHRCLGEKWCKDPQNEVVTSKQLKRMEARSASIAAFRSEEVFDLDILNQRLERLETRLGLPSGIPPDTFNADSISPPSIIPSEPFISTYCHLPIGMRLEPFSERTSVMTSLLSRIDFD